MTTLIPRTRMAAEPQAATASTQPAGTCVAPPDYQLAVYRGDTCHWRFLLWADAGKTQPVDMTGATAKAEVRDQPGGTVISPLPCTVSLPNQIDMTLSAASSHVAQDGVWDLQVTFPGGEVQTILRGSVCVTDDVTDSS